MIALAGALGLLALFSLLSILVSGGNDRERRFDPRDDITFWTRYATR